MLQNDCFEKSIPVYSAWCRYTQNSCILIYIYMISIKKVLHIWRSEIKQIGQCIKRSPMNIDCNLTTVICILGQTFNKSAVRIV